MEDKVLSFQFVEFLKSQPLLCPESLMEFQLISSADVATHCQRCSFTEAQENTVLLEGMLLHQEK